MNAPRSADEGGPSEGALRRLQRLVQRFRRRPDDSPPFAPPQSAPLPTGLTREQVVWAYRILLDRDETDEAALEAKRRTWANTEELRRDIMLSPEFRQKNPSSLGYIVQSAIVIAEIPGGARLFVNLADVIIGLNVALGAFEPSETRFVLDTVRPGQNALDVGANVGYFSMLLASRVGPAGRVIGFEPFEENVVLLERSIQENGFGDRVRVRRTALGAAPGEADLVFLPFEVMPLSTGGAYLSPTGTRPPEHCKTRRVSVVPLDGEEIPRPVHFIKLDVEGSEPAVIRGARRLLSEDHPVLLSEVNPIQLRALAGVSAGEFLDEVCRLGYRCRVLRDGHPAEEVSSFEGDAIHTVIFMRPE